MARLPLASRESVPENQRAAFDEIVKGLGSVHRYGPGSVILHVPHAHQRLMGLNRFLRSEGTLPKKLQELAMLVTARELDPAGGHLFLQTVPGLARPLDRGC